MRCSQVLVYVNADIVLSKDFADAVHAAAAQFDSFLMIGRRSEWRPTAGNLTSPEQVAQAAAHEAVVQDGCMIDYFAFRGNEPQ